MHLRQGAGGHGMLNGDGERAKAAVNKRGGDPRFRRRGQRQQAGVEFRRNLPRRGGADANIGRLAIDDRAGARAKLLGAVAPPQQGLRIKLILPLSAPKPFRLTGSTGTSRTIGRPALAMTISSPANASSTSFESWVLAA